MFRGKKSSELPTVIRSERNDMLARVAIAQSRQSQLRSEVVDPKLPLNDAQGGQLMFLPLDLSGAYFSQLSSGGGASNNGRPAPFQVSTAVGWQLDGNFYELTYDPLNSTPGGLLAVVTQSGNVYHIAPGSKIQLNGQRATIYLDANSFVIGVAMLVIARNPDVHYWVLPNDGVAGQGIFPAFGIGPNGALVQTAAVTTNNPQVSTDGIDLGGTTALGKGGVTAFRVSIKADQSGGGNTIVSGDIIIWKQTSAGTGDYMETPTDYSIPGTNQIEYMFNDEQVLIPAGRVYAEARNVVVSNPGNPNLTVIIETWSSR